MYDWIWQDELEKYQAKIHLQRLLLNSYESAFHQKMEAQNWREERVRDEMKEGLAKLEEMNDHPHGFTCKSWMLLANERCFHLANQWNTLTCNRRKKEHKLRSAKKNLKIIKKELARKTDKMDSYQKKGQELRAKLDGILSNQKEALLSSQRQIRWQQELVEETKMRFPPLLNEMEKYLDRQTRDTEEFRMVLKDHLPISSEDKAFHNCKKDESRRVQKEDDAVRLLKESIDQNRLELLKEKRLCEYTLAQLQQNRDEGRRSGMKCSNVGPAAVCLGMENKKEDPSRQILTQIGLAADRVLSLLNMIEMSCIRAMDEVGQSRWKEFNGELLAISTTATAADRPCSLVDVSSRTSLIIRVNDGHQGMSCTSSSSSSNLLESSSLERPAARLMNRPKMSQASLHPCTSDGADRLHTSSEKSSWATVTDYSSSLATDDEEPACTYTTRISFSMPCLR